QESNMDHSCVVMAHLGVHRRAAQGGCAMSQQISRRDALKAFALVSTANVLDFTSPQVERALRSVAALSGNAEQQGTFAPKFFTHHEWQLVRTLADYVIPRDARSGSATDARVPEYMDFLLADKD